LRFSIHHVIVGLTSRTWSLEFLGTHVNASLIKRQLLSPLHLLISLYLKLQCHSGVFAQLQIYFQRYTLYIFQHYNTRKHKYNFCIQRWLILFFTHIVDIVVRCGKLEHIGYYPLVVPYKILKNPHCKYNLILVGIWGCQLILNLYLLSTTEYSKSIFIPTMLQNILCIW
jgi:hypothetical protein